LLPGRGEDAIENLVPACAACNIFKGVYDLETWRQEITKQVERTRKKSSNFRFSEAFGLIRETGVPVVFWFEKYDAMATWKRLFPAVNPDHSS
jgi:recombinational DNA repair protein RecT